MIDVHHRELLFGRDAAGRLVEQQQLRLAGQRHRDVEQLAHAAGQLGDAALAVLGEPEALEQRIGARDRVGARAPAARSYSRWSWQAMATSMLSSTVSVGVELRDLERARDAEPRDRARVERA